MIKYLIPIFVLLLALNLSAQGPIYKQYTVKDGLPSNEVYYTLQDSEGYIWFATDNGVSRFNGYEFENFTTKEGLAGNVIFFLYEDFKQRIWFVSFSKQLSYFENDSIYPYQYNNLISENLMSKNIILNNSFYVDSSETVHFGTHMEGAFHIGANGELRNTIKSDTLLLEFYDGNLIWSRKTTYDSLAFSVCKKGVEYCIDEFKTIILDQRIRCLNIGGNQLLFSHSKSITKFKDNRYLKKYTYPYLINRISLDADSNLWICNKIDGAYCYKNKDLDKEPYRYLKGKSIFSVLKDKTNGYWMTADDGVYYFPSLTVNHIGSKELSNKKVNCLEVYKSNIWWSTYDSDIFHLFENQITSYKGTAGSVIQDIDYEPVSNKLMYSGYESFGMIQNEERKEQPDLILNYSKPRKAKMRAISKMVHINDTLMWYIWTHIGKMDLNTFILQPYSLNTNISSSKFQSIFLDKEDDILYIGANDGLWQYNNKEFIFLGENNHLLSYRIDDIRQDNQGNLWLATKDNGAVVYNKDTTIQILERDGLSSNSIKSIFVDEDVVWLGTMNGLNKLSARDVFNGEYEIERIYEYHGLASNVINAVATNDKNVYVGTDNGLCYFNKSEFALNAYEVPVYISKISIAKKDTQIQDAYELEYHQNTISIEFVGLSYRNSIQMNYKYRLIGVEEQWVETKTREVRYPALHPGTYQFELLAMNENGVWNSEAQTVKFIINKPYWQAWWFYTLSALLFALVISFVVYLFFRMKLKENQKREALHQNLTRLRQEALAQQMNPHFIFNTLSSIQYYINENDKNASNKYLTMFARLMRMTLDNSYQKSISIQEELDALETYIKLEQLRFNGSFSYKIEIEEGLHASNYMMPALLFQPFVENAIWHGIMHKKDKNGCIEIHLSKSDNAIFCSIIDNGIGRKRSSEINKSRNKTHKSLGAKITESRLNLINSSYGSQLLIEYIDLEENGVGTGTKVLIRLPMIIQSHVHANRIY